MPEYTVTAALCCIQLPGLDIDSPQRPAVETGVDPDGEYLVTVGLEPAKGCDTEAGLITVGLLPAAAAVSKYCRLVNHEGLAWERAVRVIQHPGYTHEILLPHLTVAVDMPRHCHHAITGLYAISDARPYRVLLASLILDGGREAPQDGSDPLPGGDTWETALRDVDVVPGERLAAVHFMADGRHMEEVPGGSSPFATCCLFGGVVEEVLGEYGSERLRYSIKVLGEDGAWGTRTVRASDHTEYAVGDWVFLMVPSAECYDCHRTERCKAAASLADTSGYTTSSGGYPLIVPMTIADIGQVAGAYDLYAWAIGKSELRPLLDQCFERGTIIEMHRASDVTGGGGIPLGLGGDDGQDPNPDGLDTADVELEVEGRVDYVPVKFRCHKEETWEHGGDAFYPDDAVILLRDNDGNRAVIGHDPEAFSYVPSCADEYLWFYTGSLNWSSCPTAYTPYAFIMKNGEWRSVQLPRVVNSVGDVDPFDVVVGPNDGIMVRMKTSYYAFREFYTYDWGETWAGGDKEYSGDGVTPFFLRGQYRDEAPDVLVDAESGYPQFDWASRPFPHWFDDGTFCQYAMGWTGSSSQVLLRRDPGGEWQTEVPLPSPDSAYSWFWYWLSSGWHIVGGWDNSTYDQFAVASCRVGETRMTVKYTTPYNSIKGASALWGAQYDAMGNLWVLQDDENTGYNDNVGQLMFNGQEVTTGCGLQQLWAYNGDIYTMQSDEMCSCTPGVYIRRWTNHYHHGSSFTFTSGPPLSTPWSIGGWYENNFGNHAGTLTKECRLSNR